jgi:protocatechuate 3,4-dioxygenase beta subunit
MPLFLPLALAAQPLQVTGRVVADGSQGVSGARVELFPAYEVYAEAVQRLAGKPGPPPLATALTDAGGRFRVVAPGSGCFRLVVRADGHLPMEYPLAPLAEDRELPALAAVKADSLEIRTVGEDGQPLPGIRIRLGTEEEDEPVVGGGLLPRWQLARWSGLSGPDGKLSHPWLLGHRPLLTVLSPRFLGQGMAVLDQQGPSVLRLAARPATRIEVRDAAGNPVAGALIRWKGEPVAVTGPRGRVEISVPEGDALTVESAGGDQAKIVPRRGNVILPVRLEPPRRVAGKIVDEIGGRPIRQAVIWMGWPPAAAPASSGADGSFQLDLPPGGEGWSESAAAGFLPGSRRFLKKGEPGPILLKLSPAATIAGLVVNSAGRALAGVAIELEGRQDTGEEEPFQTGPDGKFRLPGLRPGSAYRLTAKREGFAPTEKTVRTAPPGRASSPVRIALDDGTTVSGWIAGEDGRPVAGAELALVGSQDLMALSATHARSDAAGKFELRHLPPGTFNLIARHPGHAPLRMEGIENPAGTAPVDLGRLTMPDGVFIEGQVVDGQGSPLAEVEIMAMPSDADGLDLQAFREGENRGPERVQTGPDGRFRLEGLRPASRYELMAVHPIYGMASAPGVKAPTEEPVRIEMRKMRILSGRVVGPDSEPVAGAGLSWVQENRLGGNFSMSSSDVGVTDAEGRFQAPEFSPDLGDLVARAPGYLEGRIPRAQIPADREVTDLKIVLERGSVLDVRVVGAEGEPIPGVWVGVSPQRAPGEPQISSFPEAPRVTNAEGRSRASVTPGVYEVYAIVKGRTIREKAVVGAGTTSVELRLPAGTEIAGRVVREDGTGVSEALVHLVDAGGSSSDLQTEADGSFSFGAASDGSYRLTAQEIESGMFGRSSSPLEVAVAGQPVRGLELRLSRKSEGARLTGRLLRFPPDEIPRVQILAFGEGGTHKGAVDPSGSYSVEGLPPGSWTVQATLPSGREAKGRVQVRPGDSELTLDLDLSPGVTISGHVLVDGVPLAGAAVQSLNTLDRESRQDRTAYDGSFTLQGVGYGAVALLVGSPGGIGASRRLMIREKTEIEVEIATGRLLGKTVSAAGDPVEDATVEVEGWVEDLKVPFTSSAVRSGAGGLFEVPRLGAGLYRIVAVKPGFAAAETRVEVKPGQENAVEVRLTPK